MRVVNPSPAEIGDRLSILRLKLAYSKDERQKEAFIREAGETIGYLAAAFPAIAICDEFWHFVAEIWDLNYKIWNLTDWQVSHLDVPGLDYAEKSRMVVRLNRRRADLIRSANSVRFNYQDSGEKV